MEQHDGTQRIVAANISSGNHQSYQDPGIRILKGLAPDVVAIQELIWAVRPDWLAILALAPAGLHLANQALRADPKDGESALRLFRSNRTCGLLVFLAMLVVGLASR